MISFLAIDITWGNRMAQLIVRKIEDAVKERLRARAKKHGRSLEAEVRAILEDAANAQRKHGRPGKKNKGFGTLMHERFKDVGLTDAEWNLFNSGIETIRRGSTIKPVDFDE